MTARRLSSRGNERGEPQSFSACRQTGRGGLGVSAATGSFITYGPIEQNRWSRRFRFRRKRGNGSTSGSNVATRSMMSSCGRSTLKNEPTDQQLRTQHTEKQGWTPTVSRRGGLTLTDSASRWHGDRPRAVVARHKTVQTTQKHGTTEANSERKIANCVTCGRVRSIWRGADGECADCFGGGGK